MVTCSRCGVSGEMHYGADGLPYCSSCSFYGLNKQCWRCRMYLPATEMQQYNGQWSCPMCIQDMRGESSSRNKPALQALHRSEACERCGRESSILYIWNHRKLCKTCVDEGKDEWGLVGGKPGSSSQRIIRPIQVRKDSSFSQVVETILSFFGISRKKNTHELVPVERNEFASAEGNIYAESGDEEKKPKTEGIIKKSKDAGEKRKSSSFPEYSKSNEEKQTEEEHKEEDNPFKKFKDKKKKQ